MPALTVRLAAEISAVAAFTVTVAEAVTVIPLDSSLTELPLASWIVIEPGPSFSVSCWPPGVSSMSCSLPSVSSRVTVTPLRVLRTFL